MTGIAYIARKFDKIETGRSGAVNTSPALTNTSESKGNVMADSNPTSEPLTRDELGAMLRDVFMDTGSLKQDACIVRIIEVLNKRAGLPVAPEPVAEPSDPENYVVKSGERLYVHDPVNRFGWVNDYGNGCYWANIKQPELFRKVDTPEPAPKYVATRDSGDWIVVNGLGAISPAVTRSQLSRWRHQSLRDAAKYQAAIDLLDEEEREAGK